VEPVTVIAPVRAPFSSGDEVVRQADSATASEKLPSAEKPKTRAGIAPGPETFPPIPDDLKVIEGIGPKISALLAARGILTFTQLAATDVEALTEIMRDANLRIANPATWPEQARLAAAGDWEGLRALQDVLKAGRPT
jgi:predicted flap endonuclease-1-like 5' DNA nuclease